MLSNVLKKEYVMENGVDFDEELWFAPPYGDYVIDSEDSGKPFTGLAYELYDNDNLAYYSYYQDGVKEGQSVRFYKNARIKSISNMNKGTSHGNQLSYYENGQIEFKGERFAGLAIQYKKWDEDGNLIEEKTGPDEGDLKYMDNFR